MGWNIFRKDAPEPAGQEAGPFDPHRLDVTPAQVRAAQERGEPVVLLDVREAHEVKNCALPGHVWIPVGQIPARFSELDPAATVVTYCHVGVRSAHAARYLRAQGVAGTWSLRGGIDAWSRTVDPSIPRY